MWPALRDGDVLTVAPLRGPVRPGDVLATVRAGRLVVHRAREVSAAGVVLRGDSCAEADGPFAHGELLGRVVEARRAGHRLSPGRFSGRTGLLAARLSPVARLLARAASPATPPVADLLLALTMAIWGSSFSVLRFFLGGAGGDASQAASPFAVLAVRMAISTGLLLLFLAARPAGRLQLRSLCSGAACAPGGGVRDGAFAGLFLAGGFLLQMQGLAWTTASRSGFLTGLVVAFVPLLEWVLYRLRPARSSWLAVGLALCGLSLLAGSLDSATPTLAGDLLTIAGSLVFTGQILVLSRVARRHPVPLLLLLQLAVTGLSALAAALLFEKMRLPPSPRLWGAILYLSVFATLFAFAVQTWAQRRLSPLRVGLLCTLEPVFAALWAALLLGERLTAQEGLGGALIVAGVLIGELRNLFEPRSPGDGLQVVDGA
jgi:drug/metabolite transporter (DMT)-like permease